MGDPDLRKLRVLRELDERGTVAAVAAALHLAPSAVSQQLTALGRELGVRLTEPVGRRLRLTSAARIVLRHAEALFREVELLEAELAAHQGGELGEVAVAGFATTLSALILPAVARLRETRPGLRTTLAEVDPPESFAMLLRGETDVVISAEASPPHASAEDPRLHRVPLCADRFDVALPVGHRLAGAPLLRLADLAEEKWIFAATGMCHDIGVIACTAAGFTPRSAHAIGDWAATLSAVGLGLGVSLVPRLTRPAAQPGVVLRALAGEAPQRYLFAAVRAGSQGAPDVAVVLEALRSVAAAVAAESRLLGDAA